MDREIHPRKLKSHLPTYERSAETGRNCLSCVSDRSDCSSMRVDSEFRSLLRSSGSKGKSCLFSEIVCRFPVCSRSSFPSRSVSPEIRSLTGSSSAVRSVMDSCSISGRSEISRSVCLPKVESSVARSFPSSRFPDCDMVSSRPRSPGSSLSDFPSVRSVTDSRATSPCS